MGELTEFSRAGAFVLSMDVGGNRSRDNIVIQAGAGQLVAGTVLGAVASAGSVVSAAETFGNAGNGALTLDSIAPLQPGVDNGVYHVRFTSATSFNVEDNELNIIGTGAIGATFNAALKFVISAGSAPFGAGDGFDITVTNYGAEYVAYDENASNGAQTAAAVLYAWADATSANAKATGVMRSAEVNHDLLQFKTNATPAGKAAAIASLQALGIIVR